MLGKAGGGGGDKKDEKAEHTALGADNEKPTPWALPRLRKFVGDATGKRRREGLLLLFCCFSLRFFFREGEERGRASLKRGKKTLFFRPAFTRPAFPRGEERRTDTLTLSLDPLSK